MPSADFSAPVTGLAARSVRGPDGAEISRGKFDRLPRTPAGFTASVFDDLGLRSFLPARPAEPASYPVLVHQVAVLLHASFRPRLAATPLRFANPSPSSGWVEDLHLRAVEHARHTRKSPDVSIGAFLNDPDQRRWGRSDRASSRMTLSSILRFRSLSSLLSSSCMSSSAGAAGLDSTPRCGAAGLSLGWAAGGCAGAFRCPPVCSTGLRAGA